MICSRKRKDELLLGPGRYLVVCVSILRPRKLTDGHLVIYQQPRPGPKLPKGESYLTIGWKQVRTGLSCPMLTRISFLN